MTNSSQQRRVVIIGGGFGGLAAAKRLRKTNVHVTLIDRHNYHLFQPLLYQVATGGLSPANIATPLRYIFRRQKNCEVLLAQATGIDVQQKRVLLADGEIDYDDLIVAVGSTHSYFGHAEWAAHAPGLKSINEALDIRRRIFVAFEAAERETDLEIRRELMTFVIVGGGPTGVELAGALADIANHTLKHDFHHIDPSEARIHLIEAAPHVLAHFPESLCESAEKKIRSFGIEIHTKAMVTGIADDHVQISTDDGDSKIPTRTVLWAAGVQANPLGRILAEQCGVETDRQGRVFVTPQLNVSGHDNIFVIGDLANCQDANGNPLPGLAPVAMQQGDYVANVIADRVRGNNQAKPFHYKDRGTMATIGRAAAVAKIGSRKFTGLFAWFLWLIIHLMQIVQFESRLLILMQWMWNYITFNRSSRIITNEDPAILKQDRDDRG